MEGNAEYATHSLIGPWPPASKCYDYAHLVQVPVVRGYAGGSRPSSWPRLYAATSVRLISPYRQGQKHRDGRCRLTSTTRTQRSVRRARSTWGSNAALPQFRWGDGSQELPQVCEGQELCSAATVASASRNSSELGPCSVQSWRLRHRSGRLCRKGASMNILRLIRAGVIVCVLAVEIRHRHWSLG
jgi:hypothetical protein